ncbi:MAG: T9SS type A sorting domain-containing protein, partial [Bacteroidia bacterium]|nr:T9SS type A sorting domain-containing protein [Bacteroidia bacterium]
VEGTSLMKVYPNPSNGLFNITLDLPSSEEVTVEVIDQTGRKVANVTEGQLQKGSFVVDMSGEAAGMYIVRMITNHNVYNQKISIK